MDGGSQFSQNLALLASILVMMALAHSSHIQGVLATQTIRLRLIYPVNGVDPMPR
jgi:hypothetical protein